MPTYNPLFFDMPVGDVIPANPPAARLTPDPNNRDNVLHPQMTEAQWHMTKPRWSFSHSTGELESPYMMQEVDPKDINYILGLVWANHSKDAVKSICLGLSPECVNEQYGQLRVYGFDRAGHRETRIPQLCFIGPATRWKE